MKFQIPLHDCVLKLRYAVLAYCFLAIFALHFQTAVAVLSFRQIACYFGLSPYAKAAIPLYDCVLGLQYAANPHYDWVTAVGGGVIPKSLTVLEFSCVFMLTSFLLLVKALYLLLKCSGSK